MKGSKKHALKIPEKYKCKPFTTDERFKRLEQTVASHCSTIYGLHASNRELFWQHKKINNKIHALMASSVAIVVVILLLHLAGH